MEEIWKSIDEFLGNYEISNLGRVKSCSRNRVGKSNSLCPIKEQIRKLNIESTGYISCTFSIDGKTYKRYIHRLVAVAFLPNPYSKIQVNHKNGDKSDNRLVNLEWMSGSENCRHAIKNNLYENAKGEQLSKHLKDSDIRAIRLLYDKGVYQKDIACEYQISRQQVSKIVRYERWAHVT